MSQNVELVRRLYALFSDLTDLDPNDGPAFVDRMFGDYLDEDFELRLPGDYPEGESVFTGKEGFADILAMLRDVWAEWRVEPERFFDAGDQVAVFARIVASGSSSGVPIEQPVGYVFTIHDGRLTSARAYRERSEALEAVGQKPD